MRALGLRRGGRQAPSRPKSGWDALTPSERTVVDLVAEGLSNPEVAERLFVSRFTVKRHLSNAMLKLGFTSRMEVVRAGGAGRRPTRSYWRMVGRVTGASTRKAAEYTALAAWAASRGSMERARASGTTPAANSHPLPRPSCRVKGTT